MSQTPLTYWLDIGDRSYELARVSGSEAISEPWRLEIELTVDAALAPAAWLRSPARVRLVRDRTERAICGIVSDVAVSASTHGGRRVEAVLEPRHALLRHTRDTRAFRNKTVPQIVAEVLGEYGLMPELRLDGDYPERAYCVQYRESNFDFVRRLLEDEGIHNFTNGNDDLVLGDSTRYDTRAAPTLPFRAPSGLDRQADAILSLSERGALVPDIVTLRDFNPETPRLDLEATHPVGAAQPHLGSEWYDYPGEHATVQAGARRAKTTAEAMACASRWFEGTSSCSRLYPGATFRVEDVPGIGARDLVVTRIAHAFDRRERGYAIRFEARDADVAFRPPRTTPAPVILNPLTAFVTGPKEADRSDLYAFGLCLYMMVAGCGPFDDCTTLIEMAKAHVLRQPDSPSRFARQALPLELEAVIMKALAKRQEDRFPTAEAMRADLVRIASYPGIGERLS
jgi:type VI secretion system secreted protein VgrG